jgi:hypothetical protein
MFPDELFIQGDAKTAPERARFLKAGRAVFGNHFQALPEEWDFRFFINLPQRQAEIYSPVRDNLSICRQQRGGAAQTR